MPENYRSVFESVGEGLAVCEIVFDDHKPVDFVFVDVNPAYERLAGLRRGQIVGRRASEINCIPLPLIGESSRQAIYQGISVRLEEHIEDPDRWVKIYTYPINDRQFIISFRNISRLKETEQELDRQRSLLNAIFAATPDYVLAVDHEIKCLYISPSIQQMLGIDPEKYIGKTWRDLGLPADFMGPYDEMVRQVLKTGKPVFIKTCYPVGAEIRYFNDTLTPVSGKNGDVLYVLTSCKDVTDIKQAEKALDEAKARAELYVDLMSHDIRNMNMITMGYLEMAMIEAEAGRAAGDKCLDLLARARESLENSSTLISNVNKLQREKMGEYQSRKLDVSEILREVAGQFRFVPGREVRFSCETIDGVTVNANELLKDVFANIIGNAIKHTTGPLAIDIRMDLERDNGRSYCKISIADNGPGMPDSMKERYSRGARISPAGEKGKGLGLHLIQVLIEDYGGRLWVEDRVPGNSSSGARFVALLPITETPD